MSNKNANAAGLGVFLAKIGGKLLPVLGSMKASLFSLFKSASSVKAAGAVSSVAVYSYLFTWQMGLALTIFIGIHEYGHLWAMRHRGIRTRGMFFLPGFGAVALADERFGSARNELFIAVMGPIVGYVAFVIPMICLYQYTQNPLWAAIASFTTFVNLVNLFPILPLDGGRMMKGIAYSQNALRSLAIIITISLVAAVFAISFGFALFTAMAIIGFYEITTEFGIQKHLRSFLVTVARVLVCYALIRIFRDDLKGLLHGWGRLALLVIILTVYYDVRRATRKYALRAWQYPYGVLLDVRESVREIVRLRKEGLEPVKQYAPLPRHRLSWVALYASLILLHGVTLAWLAHTPGATLGKALMQ